MQIFVMRHGQAHQSGQQDAARELTEHGKKEAQAMANWLLVESPQIDHVLVSPFIRAQQTAKIVTQVFDCDIASHTSDLFTPSSNAAQAHDYIDGFCADKNISSLLIVAHMPLVSYLVGELTVEHQMPIFPTAGITLVDYQTTKMAGKLVKMQSPQGLM